MNNVKLVLSLVDQLGQAMSALTPNEATRVRTLLDQECVHIADTDGRVPPVDGLESLTALACPTVCDFLIGGPRLFLHAHCEGEWVEEEDIYDEAYRRFPPRKS